MRRYFISFFLYFIFLIFVRIFVSALILILFIRILRCIGSCVHTSECTLFFCCTEIYRSAMIYHDDLGFATNVAVSIEFYGILNDTFNLFSLKMSNFVYLVRIIVSNKSR